MPDPRSIAAGFRTHEFARLFLLAVAAGWRWRMGGSHVVIYPPDKSLTPVVLSITANDLFHGPANARAILRRAGLPGVDPEPKPRRSEPDRAPAPVDRASSTDDPLRALPQPPGQVPITTTLPVRRAPEPPTCDSCGHRLLTWHRLQLADGCRGCDECDAADQRRRLAGGLHR